MPMFHLIFHGYGTWFPDHDRGYYIRHHGWQPTDVEKGRRYRHKLVDAPVRFNYRQQRECIEELRRACEKQGYVLVAAVADPTHLHLMVAWHNEALGWRRVASRLKESLSRMLNRKHGRRSRWFSKGSGHKRITNQAHLEQLMRSYLPNHRGWMWTQDSGWQLLRRRRRRLR